MTGGWIGVDLDGTLAEYHGWDGGAIGAPIEKMVERVKRWLADGREVRILTARVCDRQDQVFRAQQVLAVAAWCREVFGCDLPITSEKDFRMIELWDDRCIQLVPNTGERVDGGAE